MASFDRRSFHLKNLALLLIIVLIAPSTPLNVVIAANPASDYTALLAFQSSTDFSQKLATNWSGQDPCSLTHRWYGVTCRNGRVIRLVLQGLQLTGTIDALVSLDQLRILSLSDNSFTGSLPNLTCWKYLRFLYLSNNAFTGTVPDSISALFRLFRMDLSNNALSGNIPSSLDLLSDLLTLRLQNNQLSGTIPSLNLSRLQEFNVSGNQLSGPIPFSLSNFPISSFRGNSELCGTPLLVCDSNQPWSPSMSNPMVVASTPSTKPSSLDDVTKQAPAPAKVGTREVIAIVLGDIGILLLVTCFCLLYLHWSRICQYSPAQSKRPKIKRSDSAVVSRNYAAQEGGGRMLVSLDGRKPMELEDLLRASADILGKGSFGTTYKAVLEDDSSVVVKRLKDVAASVDRREFERQMELIGRTKHRNLVCLRAYFYAREAKLIVYDYLPSGNLFSLLHGNRGPGRTPLDWKSRLKIALGAARGLAYVHHGCVSQKCFHGNIKSSNVLLDRDGNAYISDFGLVSLARPSVVTSGSIGYRAPELAETWKKVSQASDVYSFGVLLLETLTGKAPMTEFYMHGDNHESIDLPKWVQSIAREEWTSELFDVELSRCKEAEEEMVNMLQVAIMCVRWSPEQRPKMGEVVKMIENITGDHDSQHSDQTHDSIDSPSVSPLVSSEEGVFQNHYSINVI